MKIWIYTFCFFSFCYHSYGQNYVQYDSQPYDFSVIYNINSERGMEDSPLYSEKWSSGVVYYNQSLSVPLEQMNYDMNAHEILFKKEGDRIYKLTLKKGIFGFSMNNEDFLGFNLSQKYVFMKVLAHGKKIKLLAFKDCRVIKGKPSNGITKDEPGKFQTVKKYFIEIPSDSNNLNRLSPKKGGKIVSLIDDDSDVIGSFIEANKLKMNNIEDLVKVVDYYNSVNE